MKIWWLVGALSMPLLAGCSLNTDYFSEYRGVNLLGNYGFDATDSSGDAQWTLELGTDTPFMDWSEVTDDSYWPDSSTPAYRLEIKNLIPDGDFLEGTYGSYWTASGGGAASESGGTLVWTASVASDTLTLNLSDAIQATSSSAWTTLNYRTKFDYTKDSTTLNVTLDGASMDVTDSTSGTFSGVFAVSDTDDTPELVIGGSTATSATLSNVRVVPDNSSLWVMASLDSLSSGTLKLLPGSKSGMYTFSVEVRDDPDAGSDNIMQPSGLAVKLNAKVASGSGSPSPTVFARPSGGWTGWTTLKVNFGFDFVSSDADLDGDPALEIRLSPTYQGTGSVDAGSLYIANPKLTYNP